ncbi:glycosyltransferase family 2 protein [Falsirhodobacter xinxiangensis]|uniref:glycosyltransferase family 2 protein n=1 Tax=Falsirhodobacter xinxiangensis TaxID=2530049 RepID=UPI001FE82076|nr:glycosyltransferase family 2 protein [Rhodobacter xinxiangensis]
MAWNLRWKRRRILWRCFRSRGAIVSVQDRTAAIGADAILCFSTVRNEMPRLPGFLDHHRRLGVGHFLFVDNGSDDGTAEFLTAQPDVSLWRTGAGYRAARFGLDWIGWLMMRHAHGHWALVLDADEALIYPYWETRDLRALTGWLDAQGREMFPAMMLDLYPKGRLSGGGALEWFDSGNYSIQMQPKMRNLWIQGGVRSRMLLDDPRRGPTLTKVPLVKWNRRFAYVNSTHSILPRRLNHFYDGGPSGILLHDKFADGAPGRAALEKARGEHFFDPALFDNYYDALIADPVLHGPHSKRLRGWRQLEALGLMSRGGWV